MPWNLEGAPCHLLGHGLRRLTTRRPPPATSSTSHHTGLQTGSEKDCLD